jgi:hypothetical protein
VARVKPSCQSRRFAVIIRPAIAFSFSVVGRATEKVNSNAYLYPRVRRRSCISNECPRSTGAIPSAAASDAANPACINANLHPVRQRSTQSRRVLDCLDPRTDWWDYSRVRCNNRTWRHIQRPRCDWSVGSELPTPIVLAGTISTPTAKGNTMLPFSFRTIKGRHRYPAPIRLLDIRHDASKLPWRSGFCEA